MFTHIFIATFILSSLWLLLSGYSAPLLLTLGMLSSLFVAWLAYRLGLFDVRFSALRFNLNLPRFLPWFLLEVIKSNLDVSWRILHPKLPIDPNTSTVPVAKHGDVAKVVYANCITLTPGTYSLSIDTETITVHALTRALTDGLQQGEMSRRIAALEGGASAERSSST